MADVFDTGKVAAVSDERTTLEAFLDYYREAIKAKVRGLSEEDANRTLVPSLTTLAGLIKHLARVEMSWFQHRLGPGLTRRSRPRSASHGRSRQRLPSPPRRERGSPHNSLRRTVHSVAKGSCHQTTGRCSPASRTRRGDHALDHGAHDRGNRSARRSRGHLAGADRWIYGRLRLGRHRMMGPRHHVRPTAHRIATGQGRAVLMMEADHSHSSVRFGETTCTPTLPLDAKARLCEHLRRPARRKLRPAFVFL